MIELCTSVMDHGPRYAETVPGRFPVEPWSTYTNLIFLFITVYWFIRVRRSPARHRTIAAGLPVLAIGWLGGTVYHATRSHDLWLAMDWVPIMILALATVFWLWRGVTGRALFAVLAMAISMLLTMSVHLLPGLQPGHHIGIGYTMIAMSILVPSVAHCAMRWHAGWWRIAFALLAFAAAIAARQLDSTLGARYLPMGSHFLWHILGGISVFLVISYVFGAREAEMAESRGK